MDDNLLISVEMECLMNGVKVSIRFFDDTPVRSIWDDGSTKSTHNPQDKTCGDDIKFKDDFNEKRVRGFYKKRRLNMQIV